MSAVIGVDEVFVAAMRAIDYPYPATIKTKDVACDIFVVRFCSVGFMYCSALPAFYFTSSRNRTKQTYF